jgi:hypothetical protein
LGCSFIFVEREKGEERGQDLRRETTFVGEACIPRKKAGMDYEAAENNKY